MFFFSISCRPSESARLIEGWGGGVGVESFVGNAQKHKAILRKGLSSHKHAVCDLQVLKASEASVDQFCQDRTTKFIIG